MTTKKILPILLTVLFLLPFQAQAELPKVHWKLAMTWSASLVPLADADVQLAQMIKEMSGGKFIIKVEGSEKHKAPLGILDMVKGGQYEMGHSVSYYWKGKDICSIFFTSIPFGMTAEEQFAWNWYGDGNKLQQEVFDKFGVYTFPGGNSGLQMGGWFRKEINSLDDLKGLKMRIPGLAGEIFARLGVNVVNIPPGELYTALDRGTIDALEWVGPAMDLKMGFQKITPYYYAGWHEPGADMQFLINKAAFDKLPPEYQSMLNVAMRAVAADQLTQNLYANAVAWEKMKKENPNIQVKTFPEPVLLAMKQTTDEIMEEYAAKNPEFKKIYENQKAFMKLMRPWIRIASEDYLKMSKDLGK